MTLEYLWDYRRLVSIPEESRLLESMKAVAPANSIPILDYYSTWVSGWIDRVTAQSETTLVIKFEEMKTDLRGVLLRIFVYYGDWTSYRQLEQIISCHSACHGKDDARRLKANLSRGGRSSSTFRKGLPGEWRVVFDDELRAFSRLVPAKFWSKPGMRNIVAGDGGVTPPDLGWIHPVQSKRTMEILTGHTLRSLACLEFRSG